MFYKLVLRVLGLRFIWTKSNANEQEQDIFLIITIFETCEIRLSTRASDTDMNFERT